VREAWREGTRIEIAIIENCNIQASTDKQRKESKSDNVENCTITHQQWRKRRGAAHAGGNVASSKHGSGSATDFMTAGARRTSKVRNVRLPEDFRVPAFSESASLIINVARQLR
jgi:hypothetical protein